MDYGMSGGNNALSNLSPERIDGDLTGDLDVLTLGMTDDDINHITGRVGKAEKFWNEKLSLDTVRGEVEKYWLNNYYTQDDIYDYQVEYKDPLIGVAIETLVSLVCATPPQPVVTQAYDTQASYELAQQVQRTLLSKYEDLYIKSRLQMVARHLLIGYRIAVMKLRWDDTIGKLQKDGTRFGDIAVDTIRPQRIVIDAGAQNIQDIPLVGEYRSSMFEDLLADYPQKADDIMKEAGYSKGAKFDMTKRAGYMEVHFTTRDKVKNSRIEGIVWKYKGIILDSTKSPYWNYDETSIDRDTGEIRQSNFLDKPTKPYVFFNFLNMGRWVMDDISLTEWAAPLQRVHDKRGRQIVENADQANGGWVFNTTMVKATDAAGWMNNPGDKILSTGNVTQAVTRLGAEPLPAYVMQDKLDARGEINSVFGTHGAIRGEQQPGRQALGLAILSQRGDAARLNTLATSIEDGGDRLYKFMAQVFKVFYDEPQLIRYTAEDDSTTFFSFGQNQIENGTAIKVKTGSVLPRDPTAQKQDTMQLLPIIDPLNMARGLGKPNPKEWAKNVVLYRVNPEQYMTDVLGMSPGDTMGQPTQDPQALQDIQMVSAGHEVPISPNITKEYLATYQQFVQSPQFQQLPKQIQQAQLMHLHTAVTAAKKAMGMGDQRPGIPAQQTPPPGTPGSTKQPEAPNGGTPQNGQGMQSKFQQQTGRNPIISAIEQNMGFGKRIAAG